MIWSEETGYGASNSTGREVARQNRMGKDHCKNGHEYTPENTRINTKGHRSCRACHRERQRVGPRPV